MERFLFRPWTINFYKKSGILSRDPVPWNIWKEPRSWLVGGLLHHDLANLKLFSLQILNDDLRLGFSRFNFSMALTDWLTHLRSNCPRLAWSAWASKAGDINANILHMANIFTLSVLLIQLHSPLYSAVVGPSIIIGTSPPKGHRGTGQSGALFTR